MSPLNCWDIKYTSTYKETGNTRSVSYFTLVGRSKAVKYCFVRVVQIKELLLQYTDIKKETIIRSHRNISRTPFFSSALSLQLLMHSFLPKMLCSVKGLMKK